METFSNIDLYAKIIFGVIGAIVTLGKLRDSFASVKRKQEIKLDLEILEKIKDNKEFQYKDIEDKIKIKLAKAFESESDNFTNFFTGIAAFVGFGLWSLNIFNSSTNFNGWIILTLSCSLIGLSLIFSKNERETDKGVFFQIGLCDKENFRLGFIVTLLTGILTPILALKQNGFSFWQFLSGLFFLIGVGSIVRSVKRIK